MCARVCCENTEADGAAGGDLIRITPKIKRKSGPKKGVVTNCQHTDLPLYALGMCNHCYHKYGRTGLATDCNHAGQRKVYAKGKCQSCYINDYNKTKRREKKEQKKQEEMKNKVLIKLDVDPIDPVDDPEE